MGYLAIFFTTVSFLPQAIKTLKTRRVEDLSLITYLFLFLGSLSWFLYGNYLNDIPLMATNSMTTILTGLILFLIVKEKRSAIYFQELFRPIHYQERPHLPLLKISLKIDLMV